MVEKNWARVDGEVTRLPIIPDGRNSKIDIIFIAVVFVSIFFMVMLTSIHDDWILYGLLMMALAVRYGVNIAVIASSWAGALAFLLPPILKNQLGLPTVAYLDVFILNFDILFLCAVSLIIGRAISDLFNEITERRQAEEALRASEERLNLALTGSDDGLWDWNVQTGEAYFSPRWKFMLSYAEHEFPNTYNAWDSHLHPEDKQRVLKTLQEHFNDESHIYAPEFRMLTKAGSWVWIRARGRVVERDHEGHPLRMAGTHTDITERKQTEEILRKSEERFSKAFHDSPAGLTITSLADGMFIDVNESYLRMLEYSRTEVIGYTSAELNMLGAEERAKPIQQLYEQGRVTNFELQMQAKSGKLLNVLFSTAHIELNGAACALTTIIDITERKRAEEKLRNSEQRLEILHEIDRALRSAHSSREIAKEALIRIRQLIPCVRASATQFDFDQNEASFLAADFNGMGTLADTPMPLAEFGLDVIALLKQNKPWFTNDMLKETEVTELDQRLLNEHGIHAWLTLPLLYQGQLIGALNLGRGFGSLLPPQME